MIKFLKAKGYEVKFPECDVEENAGIDFYIPLLTETFSNTFLEKNKDLTGSELITNNKGTFIRIKPHSGVLIPSGFYSKFDNDIALVAFNKSGVAVKSNLQVGACVVDSSYQDIIFLNLYNWTDNFIDLPLGKKIIQFLRLKLDTTQIEYYKDKSPEEFFGITSKRGKGSLGSTGE